MKKQLMICLDPDKRSSKNKQCDTAEVYVDSDRLDSKTMMFKFTDEGLIIDLIQTDEDDHNPEILKTFSMMFDEIAEQLLK